MKKIKNYIQFIRENYAGVMAKATGKRSRKHAVAQEMERRGVSGERIRWATGWFRNMFDGKWRYEHNTNQITVRAIPEGRYTAYAKEPGSRYVQVSLPDLIANTSLFHEYPDLRAHKVIFTDKSNGQTAGKYVDSFKAIHMWGVRHTIQDGEIVFEDFPLKTLLHELQHAIQKIEGFAKGTSPESINDTDGDAYGNYLMTAGEIEARDVENRHGMEKDRETKVSVWAYREADLQDNEKVMNAKPAKVYTFATHGEAVRFMEENQKRLEVKYRQLYGPEYIVDVHLGVYPTRMSSEPNEYTYRYDSRSKGKTKGDVHVLFEANTPRCQRRKR